MTRAQTRWAGKSLSRIAITLRESLHRGAKILVRREDGQDIVEYALLTGLLSITALLVIILIGPYLRNEFQDVINGINLG